MIALQITCNFTNAMTVVTLLLRRDAIIKAFLCRVDKESYITVGFLGILLGGGVKKDQARTTPSFLNVSRELTGKGRIDANITTQHVQRLSFPMFLFRHCIGGHFSVFIGNEGRPLIRYLI